MRTWSLGRVNGVVLVGAAIALFSTGCRKTSDDDIAVKGNNSAVDITPAPARWDDEVLPAPTRILTHNTDRANLDANCHVDNPATRANCMADSDGLVLPRGEDEAANFYYPRVDQGGIPTTTLAAFMQRFGLAKRKPNETYHDYNTRIGAVTYFNEYELGLGRYMWCAPAAADGTLGCCVSNFGQTFDDFSHAVQDAYEGTRAKNTVCISYQPQISSDPELSVNFYVYGPGELDHPELMQRQNWAQLDHLGHRPVPQICTNCHGGYYDFTNKLSRNGRPLPANVMQLRYPDDPTSGIAGPLAPGNGSGINGDQAERFAVINSLLLKTGRLTPLQRQWTLGTYHVPSPETDTTTMDVHAGVMGAQSWVPSAWTGQSSLYRGAIAPYCIGCHNAMSYDTPVRTPSSLAAIGHDMDDAVCGYTFGAPLTHGGDTNWYTNISPILSASCAGGCHEGTNPPSADLIWFPDTPTNRNNTATHADSIISAVTNVIDAANNKCYMPKFTHCLSSAQQNTLTTNLHNIPVSAPIPHAARLADMPNAQPTMALFHHSSASPINVNLVGGGSQATNSPRAALLTFMANQRDSSVHFSDPCPPTAIGGAWGGCGQLDGNGDCGINVVNQDGALFGSGRVCNASAGGFYGQCENGCDPVGWTTTGGYSSSGGPPLYFPGQPVPAGTYVVHDDGPDPFTGEEVYHMHSSPDFDLLSGGHHTAGCPPHAECIPGGSSAGGICRYCGRFGEPSCNTGAANQLSTANGCEAGMFPDAMGNCIQCAGDADCAAPTAHCNAHQCVECTADAQCAVGQKCDTARFICNDINTGMGSNVVVTPQIGGMPGPITLSFGTVTADGNTTVEFQSSCPPAPPGTIELQLSAGSNCWEIESSATFVPPVEVCVHYDPVGLGIDATQEAALQLRHQDCSHMPCTYDVINGILPGHNGGVNPNLSTHTICGLVNSFSPFGLFVPLIPPTMTCVGSPGMPATVGTETNICGAIANNTTHKVGGCSGGGGGLTSCLFDGSATETIGLGVHTVTITGTAHDGSSATCTSYINVVDTTPPTLAASASPTSLWPANHKMVDVAIARAASDNCDAHPVLDACTATSSEPPLTPGSGNTNPDISLASDGFFLRAERSGTGPGRTYTITCSTHDTAGNSASASTTVTVPH